MKKKIISLLCVLVMTLASAEPIFAADDLLYAQFKNASLNELRTLFVNNFDSFDISKNGAAYNDSQRSIIILEAWQKDFSSFEMLNDNVTKAAEKLAHKEGNPGLLGLQGYSNVNLTFESPSETESANVFEIDGKEFIALDNTVDDNGEQLLFVMAKDYYGTVALDPENSGRWDDTYYKLLPYKLTNQMAFGNYSANLPESILKHLDIIHEWNVEPGSGAGFTSENTLIAPISVISATEYKKYGSKIGTDTDTALFYWTRTPVLGDAACHFTVNTAAPKTFNKNKGWGGNYLRPVFYLKSSFFKEEKMQKCGANVTAYVDKLVSEKDIKALYSPSEIKDVFGSLSVTPSGISGSAIVGEVLTTDYTYNGSIALIGVDITWMKSKDKTSWQKIDGAEGKSYKITSDDAGYFIRAAFWPTFDSAVLKNGEVTYAEKGDAVYTDASILQAVKEIDTAPDIKTLRELLQEHESLFHCDPAADKFSDDAARIFMADRVVTASDVIELYNRSVALDEFTKATDSDAKEKAENKYLLGDIPEYGKLNNEQKARVILNLFMLDTEKSRVSEFIAKEKEFIMLERFNNVERGSVSTLIREYHSELGADISKLTNYQLEIVGAYVAGVDYGTDDEKLKSAVINGIANAKKVTVPASPIEDNTADHSSGGFIQPITEKPVSPDKAEDYLFSDLQNAPWGAAAINSLAKKGILSGNGDGTFSPDRPVTRNEFVKMIVTSFDIEMTECDLPYEDIQKDSWSYKYIAAAVNAGIISGIDETHFGDGMKITREDTAVIAERLMKYKGLELESSSLTFSDSKEISDYALLAVAKMKYCGIMSGVSEDIFAPKDGTTRAMAAVIVYNLSSYYTNKLGGEEETGSEIVMKSRNDKYGVVFQLGIMKDEFIKDSKITRGELAAALAVLGNYDCSRGENLFDDVTSNNRYYKEITAVYENNIMAAKTKNLFMPDDIATYAEAYNAIIAVSGYTNFAGGRKEAERALGKEPVYARETDELTGDMAKKMFFAALEIPVLDIDGINSVKISEKNIMNINFDAYKEKGVVNAVSGMYIGGREELSDDKIIITVNSKDYLYAGNNNEYGDYLGCEVTYYYREAEGSYQILSMTMSQSAKLPLKLSFEQITNAEKDLSSITYETNGRTKKAEISKNADFIYNGKRWYAVTAADLNPDNGYITLIDTDKDDKYDVVRIENYEYIMAAQIDISDKSVLDKFSWKTYGFEEGEDAEKVNITKNGRYIKMDHLSKGDVLAVAKSRDGKLINAYVSDKRVTGIIQSKSQDDNEIQIDNNVLKCVKDFDFAGLKNNMSITVGLDWNGYAVGYYTEMSCTDTALGYLYRLRKGRKADSLFFDILTEHNEYKAFNISKKLKINDIGADEAAVHSAFSYNEASDTIAPQLIAYSLDSEGCIKRIYTSNIPEGIVSSQTVPLVLNKKFASGTGASAAVIYNKFGMTLDFDYNLLNSAVMFDITLDNGELDQKSSRVTNIGAKVIPELSEPENLYIYNSDISRVSRLCVYEHGVQGGNEGYNESFNTQAFVINKIVERYDEAESEFVTTYMGYHSGKEAAYTFSEKLTDSIDITKICPGDVLLIWLSEGKITRFRRLYTSEESNCYADETDLLCNYGDHIYTGDSIVRGGTNWDYPYDWAQHIIERAEGKSGSTSAAASRWISLYGSVDLVYKSELYSYPVIRLKVAGKNETAAFTMDENTKLYVYNISKRTIRALDNDNLNFSSNRVVLTARYGNVRDVVIYEE